MARLHRAYLRESFDPRIIDLTKRFIHIKPWLDDEPLRMFDTWVHGACIVYGLPAPKVVKHSREFTRSKKYPTWGEYIPGDGTPEDPGTIVLRKWSLISLFHQFRHHMQWNAEGDHVSSDKDAEDAQAWACSLFYCVAPRRFRRNVKAGRIAGVTEKDLLKKSNRRAA